MIVVTTPAAITIAIAIISLITSFIGLLVIFAKVVRWIDRQKAQDAELADIRNEQSIMTVGILACLKGLIGERDEKEIHKTISMIEDHLNKQAHKQ